MARHLTQTENYPVMQVTSTMIIQFSWSVILKLNGLLKTHGEQHGDLMVMVISHEILTMIVVSVVKCI